VGFRLCTLDLDGTLIRGTVFQALADGLGKGEEARRLDARLAAGELTLEENFWAELALFEGVPLAQAQDIVRRRGPWLANRERAAEELGALGLRAGVLTDQPRFLAELAGPFDPLLCSEGGVEQGRITRSVEARFDKLANLRGWCREQAMELQDVIHCGNGANDIPVFERVGLGIAVNAEDAEVARRADIAVSGVTDLRQLSEVVAQVLRQG
jgi:phosphoserine phosphatase